jgi:hypothetical protein
MSIAVSGVYSDGRMTTVQPAARAAAAARATLYAGKFHAVMMPTTPIGCFRTVNRLVLMREGTTRPYARLPSSAYHSNKSADTIHSPRACASGLPLSSTVVRARSSA